MGFDKPDLGFVRAPGRPAVAGRLLPADRPGGPRRRARRGGPAARPRGRRHLGVLRLAGLPAGAGGPRHARRARRGGPAAVHRRAGDQGRPVPQPAGDDAQGPGRRRRGPPGDAAAGRRPARTWAYDADRYARVAAERAREQQAMLGYIATGGCRMEYLRRELDDPAAAPCGRCDNCTGRPLAGHGVARPAPLPPGERLLRPGVEVTPRKMWPTGMAGAGHRRGRQDPGQTLSAEPGRALGRLTDLGWGPGCAPAARGRAMRPRWPGAGRARRGDGQGPGRLGLGAAAGRRDHPAVALPPAAGREPRQADRRDRPDALPGRARVLGRRAAEPRRPGPSPRRPGPFPARASVQQRPAAAGTVWRRADRPRPRSRRWPGSAARCC